MTVEPLSDESIDALISDYFQSHDASPALKMLIRERAGGNPFFLEDVLGRPPAEELVTARHSQTEGHPLFLTEIVQFLIEEGALTPELVYLHTPPGQNPTYGIWLRIPESMRNVVGQRLKSLVAWVQPPTEPGGGHWPTVQPGRGER